MAAIKQASKIKDKLADLVRDFLYRALGLSKLQRDLENHMTKQLDETLKRYFSFHHPITFRGDQILIHTVDNQRLFLDPRELFMALHLLEHREWETHIRRLLRAVLTSGSIFVDVGANIGVHTLFAAALVGEHGKILALEPHPITRELLRNNLEINGFLDRTEIIAHAASHINDFVVPFDYFVEHPAMSGFKVAKERIKKFSGTLETIDVKTITLDTLLENREFASVFIKIDVEGFEYDVLRGCERIMIDHHDVSVTIEYEKEVAESVMHPNVIHDIARFFERHGFSAYRVHDKGLQSLTFGQLVEETGGDYFFARAQNVSRLKDMIV